MPSRRLLLVLGCASLLTAGAMAQGSRSSAGEEVQRLIRAGQLGEAVTHAEAALKVRKQDASLWALKGIALQMQGRKAEAVEAFGHSLRLAPDQPAALRGQIQLLYEKGDPQAGVLLERLLKSSPSDNTANEMLANLEAREGQCKAALQHYDAVQAQMESHAESKMGYAGCLLGEGRPADAAAIFERLAEAYPDRALLQYDLAVALLEAKRVPEAHKVIDQLMTVDRSPDVLALGSEIYEAAGETPKAVELLRDAIVADPANPRYYVAFAALCLAHESFDAGLQMLEAGLQRVQNDPSLYISRGTLLAQTGKYEEAEADFALAEKLDAGQGVSAFARDIAELQRKQSSLRAVDVREQLQAHPDSPLLNYLYAKTLWSESGSGKAAPAEAIGYAKHAAQLQPGMTEAHDLLADMYLAGGDTAQAIAQSQESLRLDPEDQTATYHLIVAYRHAGDPESAKQIPLLVKHLSEMKNAARQEELRRKSFSLHAQTAAP